MLDGVRFELTLPISQMDNQTQGARSVSYLQKSERKSGDWGYLLGNPKPGARSAIQRELHTLLQTCCQHRNVQKIGNGGRNRTCFIGFGDRGTAIIPRRFIRKRQMTDLEQYIKNNYGSCLLAQSCLCIKPGAIWLGLSCSNWKPVTCKTWDELFELVRTSGIGPDSSPPQDDAITRSA